MNIFFIRLKINQFGLKMQEEFFVIMVRIYKTCQKNLAISPTAQWIAQSLTKVGTKCAVIGTLGSGLADESTASQTPVNTTPDAISLHALFNGMQAQGARAVAMEVSSHGIEQGRVNGVAFDVAMFTNLTRDHLDYHGSISAYEKTKARLFSWPHLKHAVINLDDRFGAELASRIDRSRVNVIGYGFGKGEIAGHKLDLSTRGLKLEITTPWGAAQVSSSILGAFNAPSSRPETPRDSQALPYTPRRNR